MQNSQFDALGGLSNGKQKALETTEGISENLWTDACAWIRFGGSPTSKAQR